VASARFLILFDYARYRCSLVAIQCGCGHVRHVTPTVLGDLFGWPCWIRDAEKRLVCQECGEKRARLVPIP